MNCHICKKELPEGTYPLIKYCDMCVDVAKKRNDRKTYVRHTRDQLVIKNVLGWTGFDDYRKQCARTESSYGTSEN